MAMCESFAMYRLPGASHCVKIVEDVRPDELHSYENLGNSDGFVFAPFKISPDFPLLLFRSEKVETFSPDLHPDFSKAYFKRSDIDNERMAYADVFKTFHSLLEQDACRKIVLSRTSLYHTDEEIKPDVLFHRACYLYPEAFVALVSAPQCGVWLVATPEILAECHGGLFRTMSLAGTMRQKHGGRHVTSGTVDWDEKNIKEQSFVSDYISDVLGRLAVDIKKSEPYTTASGEVCHITNDFTFRLSDSATLGNLLQELHPTSAVCGMPKAYTYDFINKNEGRCREYYSGFAGPLSKNGDVDLFVTLRCMKISGHSYKLYAGGGLVPESEELAEWLETEAKMETMRKCLAIKEI